MKELGLYIHIPFCASRCIYCDFTSSVNNEDAIDKYIESLVKEIKLMSMQVKYHYVVDTIYIGGGTPSILNIKQFGKIIFWLRKSFKLDLKEFTIECNPCSVTEEKLLAYKKAGVTRISLGVQSFNDKILKTIGRRHDRQTAIDAITMAVKMGFRVSIDSMLGLPYQEDKDIIEFVDIASKLNVGHISSYMLKVEEGTVLEKKLNNLEFTVPDDDRTCDLYDLMKSELEKKGYYRYEVSNFAKKGEESIHNLKYWECKDYLGLGLAAHSLIITKRYYNPSSFDEYYEHINNFQSAQKIEQVLDKKDMMEERIMLGLRLEKGMDIKKFNEDFKVDFLNTYRKKLEKVKDYIEIENGYIHIKSKYMGVMNSILIELLD